MALFKSNTHFCLSMGRLFLVGSLMLGSAVVLSGCMGSYRSDIQGATPKSIHEKIAYNDLSGALEKSPLRFKISFVADAIVPGDDNWYESNVVMQDFEADRLPGGITGFIRGKLEESLKTDRSAENNENMRFVSLDLKDVDLKILTGNLISGKFGRYYARIDGQARVSGMDGTVYMDEPVSAEFTGMRQSFTGRHPARDRDWHNMQQALLRAVEVLALDISQKLVKDEKDNALNLNSRAKYNPEEHESPEVFAP